MRKIMPLIFAVVFCLVATMASADRFWVYEDFVPPNGFSVTNGTMINYSASIGVNGSDTINGTFCLTVDTATGLGVCGTVEGGNIAGVDVWFYPYTYGYGAGSYYWRANYTHNDSTVMISDARNWNIIFTNDALLPIYPIKKENVTGDNTNFMVNYTVDVYLPYDITNNRYVYFYGYSSYLGTPLSSSERLICVYEIKANQTNPVRSGKYRVGCENYMYDSFIINYEELPYNPKYWRAKLRVIKGEIDGANLLSDTGYQEYNYLINTNLANVYPYDEQVLCDSLFYIWNMTFYDLYSACKGKQWNGQFVSFYTYLHDAGCNGGNLTINLYNAVNLSQKSSCEFYGLPNNTIDYFNCDVVVNTHSANTTYAGSVNYTAIHLLYNSTYACNNGSTFTASSKDVWYIIGIGGAVPISVISYPTYPLPINMSGFIPSLSVYWSGAFNTNTQGGLFFIAIFFLTVMAVLVIINADMVAGVCVFIYGLMVFIRLGYIDMVIMWILLVLTGLIVVYLIRKFILSRKW